jgi:hypothetical protein
MTHDELRAKADRAFEHYDFGKTTVEAMNGWEWFSDVPDELIRTVYLENPNGGDSIKVRFAVDFSSGVARVTVH